MTVFPITVFWEKKVLTHCDGQDYGYYENVEEAKEACRKDSNCAAIYDGSCNDHGVYLCPLDYTEKESSSSCLYIKPARYSNY